MKSVKQSEFPYRSIISKEKKIILKDIKPNKKYNFMYKPPGLWYGFRHHWAEWLSENEGRFEEVKKKIYKIDNLHKLILKKDSLTDIDNPNKNKVLQIKSTKDFVKFTKKYIKNISPNRTKILWANVMKDFGGIEIPKLNYMLHNYPLPNYTSKKNHEIYIAISNWYCGWDVASGNIWNSKVPHKIILIDI